MWTVNIIVEEGIEWLIDFLTYSVLLLSIKHFVAICYLEKFLLFFDTHKSFNKIFKGMVYLIQFSGNIFCEEENNYKQKEFVLTTQTGESTN